MKIKTNIENINKIAGDIAKIKGVKAVYLFGSRARNQSGKLSDIDLCVLGNLSEKRKFEVLNYSSHNLDISLFYELPVSIQFRVLKEGKPLIIKDENFVDNLKISVFKKYMDFKYIIKKYCEEILGCTI